MYMRETYLQLARFFGVGVINTIVSFVIIIGLERYCGVYYVYANLLGYGLGIGLSFYLNKTLTFCDKSGEKTTSKFLKFLGLSSGCYLLQLFALMIFREYFLWQDVYAQALAIPIYTLTNFAGSKLLIFNK